MTTANESRNTPEDRSLIFSMDEESDTRYWTEALGCTEQELREAVNAVGNSAGAVREYLHKH